LFDEGVEALPDLRGHGRSMNTEPRRLNIEL
jgi:hypothetical protein